MPKNWSTRRTNPSHTPAAPAITRIGTLSFMPSRSPVLTSSPQTLKQRHEEREHSHGSERPEPNQGESPERL